jgi:hypothetical protein
MVSKSFHGYIWKYKLVIYFLSLVNTCLNKILSGRLMYVSFYIFCVCSLFLCSIILLKMYTRTEEQRWYIIGEWKKGSINVSQVARSFNCYRTTVYGVINYYRHHNDVNYTDRYNAGCSPTVDSTQIEQLDRTVQQSRSATAAELLSLTHSSQHYRTQNTTLSFICWLLS